MPEDSKSKDASQAFTTGMLKIGAEEPPARLGKPVRDEAAIKESQAFTTETLEKEAYQKHHERKQSLLNHFHHGMLIIFWIGLGIGLLAVIIYFYHLLTPASWHFLAASQVAELKDTALTGFAGAVLGAVSSYARQHLGEK